MTLSKTDTAQTPPTVSTLLPRRAISLSRGDLAYVDHGDVNAASPAALFVHGVLVNADVWRNVIWDVADRRRCIAPDLPAHGATPVPETAGADLSLNGLAGMLDELCERLGLDQVDVVANDTGGAVAAGLRGPSSRAHPHTDAHQLRRAREFPARIVQALHGAGRGG